MCTFKTKHRLHNTNRIIIATLTALGLLMDGYQLSDLFFAVSVVIWIWLPECDLLEEALIDKFSFRKINNVADLSKNHVLNGTNK